MGSTGAQPGPVSPASLTVPAVRWGGAVLPFAARAPAGFEMPSRGAPGPPLIGRAARCAIQSGGGGGPAAASQSRLVSAPVPPWLPRAAAPPRRRRRARTSRWWCGAGRCGGSFLGGRWGPVRGQAPGWSRGGASGTGAQALSAVPAPDSPRGWGCCCGTGAV